MEQIHANKVLVVEDEHVAREALVQLLVLEGYEVRSAGGGDEALAQVAEWAPDLVLSDVSMPRGHGFGLVSALRRRDDCRDTAILLMSARDDIDRRVSGLDLGADDFVGKPIDPEELLARIRAHLRNTDRRRQLQQISQTDAPTGLLNRRGLVEAITYETARARRGTPYSILLFDLDHFKALNDTHGHVVGDLVITHAARGLREEARRIDHCGRWGGDEFVVVLSDCNAADVASALERFRSSVERPFQNEEGQSIPIFCSVGATTYEEGDTYESLLARADLAMYDDKKRRHGDIAAAH